MLIGRTGFAVGKTIQRSPTLPQSHSRPSKPLLSQVKRLRMKNIQKLLAKNVERLSMQCHLGRCPPSLKLGAPPLL
jgi:hypothetical protein